MESVEGQAQGESDLQEMDLERGMQLEQVLCALEEDVWSRIGVSIAALMPKTR
jgi:hypothetical protein